MAQSYQSSNTLLIAIRKETSITKFKQKVIAEIFKQHERVPIDRRVAGYRIWIFRDWIVTSQTFYS